MSSFIPRSGWPTLLVLLTSMLTGCLGQIIPTHVPPRKCSDAAVRWYQYRNGRIDLTMGDLYYHVDVLGQCAILAACKAEEDDCREIEEALDSMRLKN